MLIRNALALLILLALCPVSARAAALAPLADHRTEEIQRAFQNAEQKAAKASKFERWVAKKAAKKLAQKINVDFNDPVEKWLWFGIFGLGLAVVLSVFSLGVSGLVAFLAVLCLVIWLIKQGSA